MQKLAPRAKVVKAYNKIFAELLPAAARAGRAPVQVFVAGDDEVAKKTVSDIVTKGGFERLRARQAERQFAPLS
jgi:8-hydroxy-5-deazaflavin:NADPH oxidoreductase